MRAPDEYVIWSNEHKAWWRPGRYGYSKAIGGAGIYTQAEAMQIVADATLGGWRLPSPPNELPVRVEDLPEEARVLLLGTP